MSSPGNAGYVNDGPVPECGMRGNETSRMYPPRLSWIRTAGR